MDLRSSVRPLVTFAFVAATISVAVLGVWFPTAREVGDFLLAPTTFVVTWWFKSRDEEHSRNGGAAR